MMETKRFSLDAKGPLDGCPGARVFSRLVAGYMLSVHLGDFGADVIQDRVARWRSATRLDRRKGSRCIGRPIAATSSCARGPTCAIRSRHGCAQGIAARMLTCSSRTIVPARSKQGPVARGASRHQSGICSWCALRFRAHNPTPKTPGLATSAVGHRHGLEALDEIPKYHVGASRQWRQHRLAIGKAGARSKAAMASTSVPNPGF